MLKQGADFLDVGGYSSRPHADDVSEEEEIHRVVPAIEVIKKYFPEANISVDTFRSRVASRAIDAGAVMVNDISGGSLDEHMFDQLVRWKVPYILMHMKGTPQTMTGLAHYDHLIKEITLHLQQKVNELQQRGITDVIIDPGFGFAKTIEQNFELLSGLDYLQIIGKPILVGLSRKSMIWKTLQTDPEKALNGTMALHAIALLKGANILRVHDVKEAVEVVKLIKFVQ